MGNICGEDMIDLTKDKDEIIKVGKRRHDIARQKGRNPLNQMCSVKTAKRDILGVRGEFAVARALGIELESTAIYCTKGDPDKGYDGIYKGWTYEAKDTDHPRGRLFYQPKTHSFNQDIWILVVPLEKSNNDKDICWHVTITGWVWRKDMSKLWQPCFFDPSAYCIEQSQLNSFNDLINLNRKQPCNVFF